MRTRLVAIECDAALCCLVLAILLVTCAACYGKNAPDLPPEYPPDPPFATSKDAGGQ